MRQYYYTNKLIIILAIANIIAIITSIWSMWFFIAFFSMIRGNTTPLWSYLSSLMQWFFVLGVTTWAFFKKLRWVVLLYILYLSSKMHIHVFVRALAQDWKDLITGNFLVPENFLGSVVNLGLIVDHYFYIFLWALTLTTVVVMLIETDYKDLYNRWYRIIH